MGKQSKKLSNSKYYQKEQEIRKQYRYDMLNTESYSDYKKKIKRLKKSISK